MFFVLNRPSCSASSSCICCAGCLCSVLNVLRSIFSKALLLNMSWSLLQLWYCVDEEYYFNSRTGNFPTSAPCLSKIFRYSTHYSVIKLSKNCKSVHNATSQPQTLSATTKKTRFPASYLELQFAHSHVLLNNLRSDERTLVLVILNHLLQVKQDTSRNKSQRKKQRKRQETDISTA